MNSLGATYAAVCIIAAITSWTVTRLLIPVLRRKLMDIPNSRSSHIVPTPRGGGLGILAGVAGGITTAAALANIIPGFAVFIGMLVVAIVSIADDALGGIGQAVRLCGHLAAAIIVVSRGTISRLPLPEPLNIGLSPIEVFVTVVWIVGVTNLYNFLDGIDGFAAVQGAISGLALSSFASNPAVSIAGLSIAGACFGFVLHNWHPARVFMGDIGSTTIGFALASLPLAVERESRADLVFLTFISLWFFLADGTFTILRRLVAGEKIWTAHRMHVYQRLVGSGLSHDQVVIPVASAASTLTFLAVLTLRSGSTTSRWLVIAIALTVFAAYVSWAAWREQLTDTNH